MSEPATKSGADLIDRLRHNRTLLARALTAVENDGPQTAAILQAIQPLLGHAHVVGFTGAPGAGKSTLVNALISEFRKCGKTVAVTAVDPSSPLTGGAILGDRVRMGQHAGDEGVFIRSLAARGHLGGLSASTARVIDVLDGAGWDCVLVETVGTGQSEVEIAELADTKVVVCAPGLGDDIQAIKAGVLEIADILVVNKADLPLAERTAKQLKQMLHLRSEKTRTVPLLTTVATKSERISELADHILALRRSSLCSRNSLERSQRLLAKAAARQLEQAILTSSSTTVIDFCEQIQRGEQDADSLAKRLLREGY